MLIIVYTAYATQILFLRNSFYQHKMNGNCKYQNLISAAPAEQYVCSTHVIMAAESGLFVIFAVWIYETN